MVVVHFLNLQTHAQDFWEMVRSDPRGEGVDKGNMKIAFDGVSHVTVM